MDQISEAVVEKGLEPPTFHVFSETVRRCPSEEAGLFEEFPTWPVALEEVCRIRQKCEHMNWVKQNSEVRQVLLRMGIFFRIGWRQAETFRHVEEAPPIVRQ